ncbi:MAG TPA: hypothetical protein VFU65_00650 [Actinocrinis sp.]|nr:hypothetical protein [Actinocrinis sp.]
MSVPPYQSRSDRTYPSSSDWAFWSRSCWEYGAGSSGRGGVFELLEPRLGQIAHHLDGSLVIDAEKLRATTIATRRPRVRGWGSARFEGWLG